MTPGRMTKMLARRMMVTWRERPTRYDIEALQANIERVGLVIRVRWALVTALSVYSIIAAWAYSLTTPLPELVRNMTIPAIALVFVLAYNTLYQRSYRRLGNIAVLNHLQLGLDVLVVTLLVYYSGGVHSWFWTMYALFILEAAFILPKTWHTWAMAGFSMLCSGIIAWGEYFSLMSHVTMPYVTEPLHLDFTFVLVRYLWWVTLFAGTATVATRFTAELRRREKELVAASGTDEKTGLCDRAHFLRALAGEITRAERGGHAFYVVLVDIDHLDRFNRLFGIDRGDRLLRAVATGMASAVKEHTGSVSGDMNGLCRYGGEEFAGILSESITGEPLSLVMAEGVAEAIRDAAASVRIDDAGVTVSIGIARYPEDGRTRDELLDAADEALSAATAAGGNAVRSAQRTDG